jgi:Fe2+ or Zn2+ uptake regulation protein
MIRCEHRFRDVKKRYYSNDGDVCREDIWIYCEKCGRIIEQ